ncbi:MAG: hypothetical protein J7639_15915 [Paenibacillaceae bacterium]|nr:hypothetical protein [Paenibacillaceae bacterium]
MASDFEQASHLAQLGQLEAILQEAGITTNLLEASDSLPLPVLLAGVPHDDKGRERYIHFSFLPLDDTSIDAIQLVQLYAKLPFAYDETERDAAAATVAEINTRVPIGHFGLEEEGGLHYRYVYCMSAARSFDRDVMLELVSLFVTMFGAFAEQAESGLRP